MKYTAPTIIFALVATHAAAQGIDFTMTPRPGIDWASVPVLRSVEPDTITVLDIAPNGRPKPLGTLGVAWIHVCTEDPDAHDGGLSCAVMAAHDDAMRFGSSSYGEAPRPIEFLIGNKVVARMDARTFRMGDFDAAQAARRIAKLEAEVQELRSAVRGLMRRRK